MARTGISASLCSCLHCGRVARVSVGVTQLPDLVTGVYNTSQRDVPALQKISAGFVVDDHDDVLALL